MPLLSCRNDATRRLSERPRPCPTLAAQSLLVQDNPWPRTDACYPGDRIQNMTQGFGADALR